MEIPPSIRVENLSRNYGTVAAIRNVSFEVKRGEIVGIGAVVHERWHQQLREVEQAG